MKEIINKYEKELKELRDYRDRLITEYCKKEDKETRDTYYKVLGKIETISQVILDLQKVEEFSKV